MKKYIKVPNERVSVIIGKKGETKREIEKKCNVNIEIEENSIEISGEPLDVLDSENVIKSIGRGFSPEKAFMLLDEDYSFEIIELGDDEKNLKRIRSRIIGSDGKARKNFEKLTETYISVYGKTVSIIGKYGNIKICKNAIEKLIDGSPHKYVYEFLERKRIEIK